LSIYDSQPDVVEYLFGYMSEKKTQLDKCYNETTLHRKLQLQKRSMVLNKTRTDDARTGWAAEKSMAQCFKVSLA
jgi:hypothetical protein